MVVSLVVLQFLAGNMIVNEMHQMPVCTYVVLLELVPWLVPDISTTMRMSVERPDLCAGAERSRLIGGSRTPMAWADMTRLTKLGGYS